jgi:hypothetical protein
MLFVFTVGVVRYRDASAYNVESLGGSISPFKIVKPVAFRLN